MSTIVLRYLASRKWMEAELLAGNPIQSRDQRLSVDLTQLDPDLRARVEAVADAVFTFRVGKKEFICVLDSGIDPELSFGPDPKQMARLDASITETIGALPELPEPTEDLAAVLGAWEQWLEEYKELALGVITQLNKAPPPILKAADPLIGKTDWEPVEISFGYGVDGVIALDSGSKAVRAALAGNLWDWAAAQAFSSESYEAALEATEVSSNEGRSWVDVLPPEKLAEIFLAGQKKLYRVAKAHHVARRARVPDFEVEMGRWAEERGSDRLRLGIQDGYRMNSRYLTERLAAEAPGMFAMPASDAQSDWAYKANSPSEEALRLRRKIAAAMERSAPRNLDGKPEPEIVIVRKPPHGLYFADAGTKVVNGLVGKGLPKREGWPWGVVGGQLVGKGPKPFEAIVIKHWLGKFHLIGAVGDDLGIGPAGIWAVPEPAHFGEDGIVDAQDPDAPAPDAAKRKPPEPEKQDDIPF